MTITNSHPFFAEFFQEIENVLDQTSYFRFYWLKDNDINRQFAEI